MNVHNKESVENYQGYVYQFKPTKLQRIGTI